MVVMVVMVVAQANGVGPHLAGTIHEVEGLRMEEAAGTTAAGQDKEKAVLGVAIMKKHQQQHQS